MCGRSETGSGYGWAVRALAIAALGLAACAGDGDSDTSDDMGTDTEVNTEADTEADTEVAEACTAYGGFAMSVAVGDRIRSDLPYRFTATPRDYTVSFWVMPAAGSFAAEARVVEWTEGVIEGDPPATGRGYWVIDLLPGGTVQFETRVATDSDRDDPIAGSGQSDVTLDADVWQHVAVVISDTDGEVRFFIDGESAGTYAPPQAWWDVGWGTGHLLSIGGRGSLGFDGQLDDVQIWDIARSVADIRDDRCTRYDADTAPDALGEMWDFETIWTSLAGVAATPIGEPVQLARP